MTETLAAPLDFYATHNCALFPIKPGKKEPFGIISSFAHDWSRDPAQWASWQTANPDCNFGLVAGPSRLIVVDVDVAEVGREVAWRYWSEWCASHDLPVYAPTVQSARGGWHLLFSLPPDLDIATLRQCPLVGKIEGVSKKAIIDLRVGSGFVVAAGSYYDGTAKGEQSGAYLLMSDNAPHPAPAALLAACARVMPKTNGVSLAGSRDRGDVAALLLWMSEKEMFSDYESWLGAGLALKIEYGDDALDLWEICHDTSVTADVISSKWQSFADEPKPGMTTLNSLLANAHAAGWRGTIRKSTASMFDGVAQLAAMSGASLSSGMPTPPASSGMPMMAGQQELTRLALPILAEFLAATSAPENAPKDAPTLPAAMDGHGLYASMQTCISRAVALAEQPAWKAARVTDMLAVLNLLHADVFDALCRRLRAMGHTLQDKKIRLAAANLSEKVERITVGDAWIYDAKGLPEPDNSDNVTVLLGVLGLDLRWNAWLERMEIQGGVDLNLRWKNWTYVDDTVVAKLRTRANRTKTRFRPGKDFLWESLLSLAHANPVDPVVDLLTTLANEWDGTPRLDNWLITYCGAQNDNHGYHKAVARLLIGGMVTRIRQPGVKFDTMPIFFGKQGTGKSTMLSILAMSPAYFSDSILLGDASKELVLSLAGKALVEISEMGMRGNSSIAQVKAMLSRDTDAGRTAYARAVTERPRRNIFCGTTNEDNPLVDSENRRFLPVAIDSEIDLVGLRRDVFQLVGEAARRHAAGESFDLPPDLYSVASEHQEAARSVSDVEARLVGWFSATPFTSNAFVSTDDLAELSDLAGWRGIHSFRNGVLKKLGFREVQPYLNGTRTRGWLRGGAKEAIRYTVGRDAAGRVRVSLRQEVGGGARPCPPCPPLPY